VHVLKNIFSCHTSYQPIVKPNFKKNKNIYTKKILLQCKKILSNSLCKDRMMICREHDYKVTDHRADGLSYLITVWWSSFAAQIVASLEKHEKDVLHH
jgi:hypothetical protein